MIDPPVAWTSGELKTRELVAGVDNVLRADRDFLYQIAARDGFRTAVAPLELCRDAGKGPRSIAAVISITQHAYGIDASEGILLRSTRDAAMAARRSQRVRRNGDERRAASALAHQHPRSSVRSVKPTSTRR